MLVVPVAEELAFRGFLARYIVQRDFEARPYGRWSFVGAGVSALLFGLLHGEWLLATAAGLLFSAIVWRTRRLAPAIIAHGVANGVIAAVGLVLGDFSLLT